MKKYKIKVSDKTFIINASSDAEAVKKLKDFKKKKLGDAYYTESEKKDKTFVKNAIEEMSGYISNWNFMSAEEKRSIGSSLSELKARVEELRKVADEQIINDANSITYDEYKKIVRSIPKFGDARVEFFEYNGSIDITVNWSSLGGVSSSEAVKFASDLLRAIDYAKTLENKYKGYKLKN